MTKLTLGLAVGMLAAVPALANAQTDVSRRFAWGAQVGIAFHEADLGVGGRLSYPFGLAAPTPITGTAEANWFPGTVDLFDLNYDLAYHFRSTSSVAPYAGGGLNVAITSGLGRTRGDFGLNAIGGLQLGRLGRLTPFVEGRYTFFSLNNFVLTAGVQF